MAEDTVKLLGKLIEGPAERDAVHVAVLPVVADERLAAGDEVVLAEGTRDHVIRSSAPWYRPNGEPIGVVDPFLRQDGGVEPGQRVFVFLFPGSIQGLRHYWTHPVVDATPRQMSESEQWLRRFAQKWRFDFDDMISLAGSESDEEYVVADGKDLHGEGDLDPGEAEEFWEHFAEFTKTDVTPEHRAKKRSMWSCSC